MRINLKMSIAAVSLFLLASCGNDGELKNETTSQTNDNFSLVCGEINKRMSECEFEKVYSDEVLDGVPLSKDPIVKTYSQSDAPADVKREWGSFKYFGEIKGYLNLGSNVSSTDLIDQIKFFETLSGYKNIKTSSGEELFNDTYNADSRWRKIGDEVDGVLPEGSDFFKLVLKAKLSGFTISVNSSVLISQDDDKLTVYLKNESPVRVPFVGTVIEKDGFRLKWEFYPYRNGYIVYAGQAITALKFEDEIESVFADELAGGIFNWFKTSL